MSQFTLGSVVKSMACLAITTVLVWPVVAGQTPLDAIIRQSLQNGHTISAGMDLYAADWNQTLPRLDNNGSCLYAQLNCDTPDWGDFRLAHVGSQSLERSKRVLFFGALLDYLPDHKVPIDPLLGPTDWRGAIANPGATGFVMQDWSKFGRLYDYFDAALPIPAVNIFAIDYGPTGGTNTRPLAPRGRLSLFSHPESTILVAMTSTWDYAAGPRYQLGDLAVWPSWADSQCIYYLSDGWTRYSIPKSNREGIHIFQGDQNGLMGSSNRATKNPYLKGRAAFIMADGHVELMTYPQAERCEPTPAGHQWQGSSGAFYNAYYPLWVPEAIP